MVRTTALILSLAALLALTACSSSATPLLKDFKLTKSDNGKTFEVNKGSTVEVTLEGNPTTGYLWGLLPTTQNDLVLKPDSDYTFKSDNPNLVGSGGKFLFKFQAANPGTAVLKFGYQRPWESVPPAETFDVTISVKDVR
jgi:inhibitor of cysteine peptidase